MPTCVYINNKRAHQSQGRARCICAAAASRLSIIYEFSAERRLRDCIASVRETDGSVPVALDSLVFGCKNSTANEMTSRLVRESSGVRVCARREVMMLSREERERQRETNPMKKIKLKVTQYLIAIITKKNQGKLRAFKFSSFLFFTLVSSAQ